MAAVVVYPLMNDSAVLAARAPAAIMGEPGAMVTKAPMVATLVASRLEFRRCRPRKMSGFDDMRPASFIKATMDPVKVMPPGCVSLHTKSESLPGDSTYQ
jgi:hypothetical protein